MINLTSSEYKKSIAAVKILRILCYVSKAEVYTDPINDKEHAIIFSASHKFRLRFTCREKCMNIENRRFHFRVIKNQQQTQPSYDTRSKIQTWATLVSGMCFHYGTIHVPHKGFNRKAIQ